MGGGRDSAYSANSAERSGPIQVESIDKKNQPDERSSLDLMEREIGSQPEKLALYASESRRTRDRRYQDPSKIVFTGSGDSYSASLFAHYLSRGIAAASDPYELLLAPEECKNKTVVITSVSGRTRANVELAKQLKSIARNRIAITANPISPLAKGCDQVIRLPYTSAGSVTPGTLSFTLTILTVASMIQRLPNLHRLENLEARAKTGAQRVKTISQKFLFIGAGVGYALAAYGAFKIHEILGQQAEYEHTEQVGHSKLFSLRKTDNIVCFATPNDRETFDLSRELTRSGFHSHLISSNDVDPVLAGLEGAFAFQHLALNLARRGGLKEVAFLSDRKMLNLSTRLIY